MKDFRFVISENAEALETRTLVHHAFVPITRYRNSCCSLNISAMTSGGGQGGENPGEYGQEMGGKREETDRDAGAMRVRETGEE